MVVTVFGPLDLFQWGISKAFAGKQRVTLFKCLLSCADNKFGQKFDDLTKALLTSTKMFEESSQNDLIGR